MSKYFLKPLKTLVVVYLIAALGIAADIAQLTSFNLLDYLKNHLPQSAYFVIAGTLLLYLVLVIIEFIRNILSQHSYTPNIKADQLISTGNVKKSTIIQIKKVKED